MTKGAVFIKSHISALLLAQCLSGCAINNQGFVDVQHYENKTMHRVDLKTFGCFLSTNAADAGLTFGFTKRQYYYPIDTQIKELDLSNMLNFVKQDPLIKQETNQISHAYADTAIAWRSDTKGLVINASRNRVGLTLGISRIQRIKLHRDFKGVFIFKQVAGGDAKVFYQQSSLAD